MALTDIFALSLASWDGIFIMFCLIALAVFLFFRRSFNMSGVVCFLIGFLLLNGDYSILIAGIPFFIGTLMIIGGIKKN